MFDSNSNNIDTSIDTSSAQVEAQPEFTAEALQQDLQDKLASGEVELNQEQLFQAQQAYLTNLANTFDDKQQAKYEEVLSAYERYVDEVEQGTKECFKQCKLVEGVKTYNQQDKECSDIYAIAGSFQFLKEHGKLSEDFWNRFAATEEKLFLSHLRRNSCMVLRPEQQEQIVYDLEQRVLHSILGLFSFQAEQTVKSLMVIKREGMLDVKDTETYRKVIANIKEKKLKLLESFNNINEYLGFMEIPTHFIEKSYETVVALIDEFENEVNISYVAVE